MHRFMKLAARLREIALMTSINEGLEWDLEVMMPESGSDYRAKQMAFLQKQVHAILTSTEFGRLVDRAENENEAGITDLTCARDIAYARRMRDRALKLPAELVEKTAEAEAKGQLVWAKARKQSDFSLFLPGLQQMVELKRQAAQAYGYQDHPYDPLMDEYEPGATVAQVKPMLDSLADFLSQLVAKTRGQELPFPPVKIAIADLKEQARINRQVAEALGFDFRAGRLDASTHPFTATYGSGDVRLTTRYLPEDLLYSLYSTIHEAGHGMYEQGMDSDGFGLARGSSCSLGIHESQSRVWENTIGRSRSFCLWLSRLLGESYDRSPVELFRTLNQIQPSFIRTEADEVTYNLHICLRFKLECQLIEGSLRPADLPEAWNGAFKEMFGLDVPSDDLGVLQDVHWSCGLFGYFPTYTLGNLHSAQLYAAAERELGSQQGYIAVGEFKPLHDWFQRKVYRYGATFTASELIERATGAPPDPKHFQKYLQDKFSAIYSI